MTTELTRDEVELLARLLDKAFTEDITVLREFYKGRETHEADLILFELKKKINLLNR